MKILVIEDNESVSSMIELFFLKEGIEGEFVKDGLKAMNWRSRAAGIASLLTGCCLEWTAFRFAVNYGQNKYCDANYYAHRKRQRIRPSTRT